MNLSLIFPLIECAILFFAKENSRSSLNIASTTLNHHAELRKMSQWAMQKQLEINIGLCEGKPSVLLKKYQTVTGLALLALEKD